MAQRRQHHELSYTGINRIRFEGYSLSSRALREHSQLDAMELTLEDRGRQDVVCLKPERQDNIVEPDIMDDMLDAPNKTVQ